MLRNENVRPYLVKNSQILNLNGLWDFAFDDENVGHQEKWFSHPRFPLKISVPFPYESKLSGIEKKEKHDHIWYHRRLKLSFDPKKRYVLHFHGLDFYGEIYVNGELAFSHEGGSSPFQGEISDKLKSGENEITVYCFDPMEDQSIPRGKQYWKERSESIFYSKCSGIYKNVYLEILERQSLESIQLLSDIDRGVLKSKERYHAPVGKIVYEIRFRKETILKETIVNVRKKKEIEHELRVWDENKIEEYTLHDQSHCWSPEHPTLYDLTIKTYDENGKRIETIKTYFAMRKVHVEKGIFYLNNRPYYQKLVLIQGYFKDGILSYPSVSSLKEDILQAKAMGFNGGRMHQKIEDPYYYYLCDQLGFIAWLESPSGQIFGPRLMGYMQKEWHEIIENYYNFPSILVYVPLNESWGIPDCGSRKDQQYFQNAMYYLCKSLDPSRLVVGNDGWELAETDIISVHNYMHGGEDDGKTYRTFLDSLKDRKAVLRSVPGGRKIVLDGYEKKETPIMLTEFGGVCLKKEKTDGWGYSNANNDSAFLKEIKKIYSAIRKSKCVVGYCYTQLYDVEQEKNGLMTYERKNKIPPEKIKEINESIPECLQKIK